MHRSNEKCHRKVNGRTLHVREFRFEIFRHLYCYIYVNLERKKSSIRLKQIAKAILICYSEFRFKMFVMNNLTHIQHFEIHYKSLNNISLFIYINIKRKRATHIFRKFIGSTIGFTKEDCLYIWHICQGL